MNTSTVGLMYPGEMGAALAVVLAKRGARVVTSLDGRGRHTAERCFAANIAVLASFREVVRASDMLISLVPPSAATEIAEHYCRLAHLAPAGAIYVDMNSISPEQATAMADQFMPSGVEFVDGAINGLAKNLASGGTLFLSGTRAAAVAGLLGDALRIELLGDRPGRASAMKMFLSGLSKGVCALFVETALAARRVGMFEEMSAAYARIYPGVTAIVERMLPTYAKHSARRAVEMRELEQTARAAGIEPCVLAATRYLHELIATVDLDSHGAAPLAVNSVIERLAAADLLHPDSGLVPLSHATNDDVEPRRNPNFSSEDPDGK